MKAATWMTLLPLPSPVLRGARSRQTRQIRALSFVAQRCEATRSKYSTGAPLECLFYPLCRSQFNWPPSNEPIGVKTANRVCEW